MNHDGPAAFLGAHPLLLGLLHLEVLLWGWWIVAVVVAAAAEQQQQYQAHALYGAGTSAVRLLCPAVPPFSAPCHSAATPRE